MRKQRQGGMSIQETSQTEKYQQGLHIRALGAYFGAKAVGNDGKAVAFDWDS